MIKGFEYDGSGVALALTVEEALPRAMDMLQGLELREGTICVDALVWGLQGRMVGVTAAQDTLRHLNATGVVAFTDEGNVRYPPLS